MDKGAKEQEEAEGIDIKRRLDDIKNRWTLRDEVLTNQLSSHDTFNAWRNPLYELLRVVDGTKNQAYQVKLIEFIALYLIQLFNSLEATVDIQQHLTENLAKASSAKTQDEFKKILRSIRKDSAKVRKVTPEDVENLKWLTEYIKRGQPSI